MESGRSQLFFRGRHIPLHCIQNAEVRRAEQDELEIRGEILFSFRQTGHEHKEWIRYNGRVIAKNSMCSVVYLLIENITEQKHIQQKVVEATEQIQVLNEISKSILSKSDIREAMESLLCLF